MDKRGTKRIMTNQQEGRRQMRATATTVGAGAVAALAAYVEYKKAAYPSDTQPMDYQMADALSYSEGESIVNYTPKFTSRRYGYRPVTFGCKSGQPGLGLKSMIKSKGINKRKKNKYF